ncbi:MAG TPA: zinc-ribbon domain-containing protein [Longimicrobiales bacterium]|nr:zinc-ribbon domain-containing protein [Longimicrobiales bacterium]
MNVTCPYCEAMYRVDPERVPAGGVRTRCGQCRKIFDLGKDGSVTPRADQATDNGAPKKPAKPVFGAQDPDTRAHRIARALVSDIIAYTDRDVEASRTSGSLRADFREDILKSWEEYVEQVGEDFAKTTPFFRDALNDILAKGEPVF